MRELSGQYEILSYPDAPVYVLYVSDICCNFKFGKPYMYCNTFASNSIRYYLKAENTAIIKT